MSKPLTIPSAVGAFTQRPTMLEQPPSETPPATEPTPQPKPHHAKAPAKSTTAQAQPPERVTMPLLRSDTDALDKLVAYLHRRRRRYGYRGRVSQATALRLALTVAHDLLESDPEVLEAALPRLQ